MNQPVSPVLIRWEQKPENGFAMLHLTCVRITYRAARLLGYALVSFQLSVVSLQTGAAGPHAAGLRVNKVREPDDVT